MITFYIGERALAIEIVSLLNVDVLDLPIFVSVLLIVLGAYLMFIHREYIGPIFGDSNEDNY